jgi:hypothetical protein
VEWDEKMNECGKDLGGGSDHFKGSFVALTWKD